MEGADLKFKTKMYESEADICRFVTFTVKDANYILEKEGMTSQSDIKLERSLLSCHPDIMVVQNRDGVGLLAIKVKQALLKRNRQS
jgi:hypothetical protein